MVYQGLKHPTQKPLAGYDAAANGGLGDGALADASRLGASDASQLTQLLGSLASD